MRVEDVEEKLNETDTEDAIFSTHTHTTITSLLHLFALLPFHPRSFALFRANVFGRFGPSTCSQVCCWLDLSPNARLGGKCARGLPSRIVRTGKKEGRMLFVNIPHRCVLLPRCYRTVRALPEACCLWIAFATRASGRACALIFGAFLPFFVFCW